MYIQLRIKLYTNYSDATSSWDLTLYTLSVQTQQEGKTAADIAHKVNSEVYWELLKRGASLSSLQSKV